MKNFVTFDTTMLDCSDPQCCDSKHSSDRDNYVLDILCSIVESTHTTLPLAGGRRAVPLGAKAGHGTGGNIPGWTEEVEPFRDQSIFWHSIWVSAGRPNKGELHSVMSSTRNKYHYAVRRIRRQSDFIKAKKLFEASIDGEMQLLKEMKQIKCGKKVSDELPDNVSGAEGETEIVDKFREVYQALYNSAGSSIEMEEIKAKLSGLIKTDSVVEVMKITGAVVKKAASLMKTGKADVTEGFTSDAILNAPDSMFDQLACVYRSWLIHGSVTPSLLAPLEECS